MYSCIPSILIGFRRSTRGMCIVLCLAIKKTWSKKLWRLTCWSPSFSGVLLLLARPDSLTMTEMKHLLLLKASSKWPMRILVLRSLIRTSVVNFNHRAHFARLMNALIINGPHLLSATLVWLAESPISWVIWVARWVIAASALRSAQSGNQLAIARQVSCHSSMPASYVKMAPIFQIQTSKSLALPPVVKFEMKCVVISRGIVGCGKVPLDHTVDAKIPIPVPGFVISATPTSSHFLHAWWMEGAVWDTNSRRLLLASVLQRKGHTLLNAAVKRWLFVLPFRERINSSGWNAVDIDDVWLFVRPKGRRGSFESPSTWLPLSSSMSRCVDFHVWNVEPYNKI